MTEQVDIPARWRAAGAAMMVSGLLDVAFAVVLVMAFFWVCGLGLLWLVPAVLAVAEVSTGVALMRARQLERRHAQELASWPVLGLTNALFLLNPVSFGLSALAFWLISRHPLPAPVKPPKPVAERPAAPARQKMIVGGERPR